MSKEILQEFFNRELEKENQLRKELTEKTRELELQAARTAMLFEAMQAYEGKEKEEKAESKSKSIISLTSTEKKILNILYGHRDTDNVLYSELEKELDEPIMKIRHVLLNLSNMNLIENNRDAELCGISIKGIKVVDMGALR